MSYEPAELAWAAGFFDGEGSVGAYRVGGLASTRPRPMVQIAQTDPAVLERFARAVGRGRVTGPFHPRTPNSRPYWCYRIEGPHNCYQIGLVLWEFLSEIKRHAFQEALEAYETWWSDPLCRKGHRMAPNKNGRPYCPTCSSAAASRRWETRRQQVA